MPSLSGDVYYTGDTTQYTYIENDTYLLYTEVKNAFVGKGETSDDATFESGQLYVNCKEFTTDGTQTTYSADIFAPDSNVASCDFYYYYPIDESGAYSSTAGTVDSPKTYAVVYGYNDVKGLAEDEDDNNDGIGEATALIDDGLVWPYAAIRSVEDGEVGGVTHARGGTFTTNFGTDNTYGIYSVGGTMTVGTDSKSTPPKFTATGRAPASACPQARTTRSPSRTANFRLRSAIPSKCRAARWKSKRAHSRRTRRFWAPLRAMGQVTAPPFPSRGYAHFVGYGRYEQAHPISHFGLLRQRHLCKGRRSQYRERYFCIRKRQKQSGRLQ